MNRHLLSLATAAALGLAATSAQAVTCSLHASNVGIEAASFSCSEAAGVITITETFVNAGLGAIVFNDLVGGTNYTVRKVITNSTGASFSRMANELLDPSGNQNDSSDPVAQPAFVPVGFSTSNDGDGLSFAQGSGLSRTSTVFASVLADELSDARDFLDFFNGSLADGAVDNEMTFGLRDNLGSGSENQPFLLIQRPNEFSRVPEPGALALLGLGLGLMSLIRLRRKG